MGRMSRGSRGLARLRRRSVHMYIALYIADCGLGTVEITLEDHTARARPRKPRTSAIANSHRAAGQ